MKNTIKPKDKCILRVDEESLIVGAPTDIFYEVRVGGIPVTYVYIEGFVIPLSFRANHFRISLSQQSTMDCEYGCGINEKDVDIDYMMKYAKVVDNSLAETINEYNDEKIIFRFDYSKINELREGLWPVIFQMRYHYYLHDSGYNPKLFTGYIHLANCD